KTPAMDITSTDVSRAATRKPVGSALDRLTGFGPRGGFAAIIAALTILFFALGFATPYWRNADMDFMVIYNALLLNAGQPQHFFHHPAYLTFLSVKFWFQGLHALGLLDAWTLEAIPSAADPAAFDAAMTHAVRAARLVSWLTTIGFVAIFAVLIRRI